eukprot:TRINITY_DN2640_c0_g1_i1.p1 TRINITY_DN2640_c0_g1~~TRINITY_DN2640_c0_g1_i1.p1  ORF type:complete len:842 (-),score=155.00 TRINITY_DN2640_c0_g1_i1:187-2415(-)
MSEGSRLFIVLTTLPSPGTWCYGSERYLSFLIPTVNECLRKQVSEIVLVGSKHEQRNVSFQSSIVEYTNEDYKESDPVDFAAVRSKSPVDEVSYEVDKNDGSSIRRIYVPLNPITKEKSNLFTKNYIYPLFHYDTSSTSFDKEGWEYYKEVNQHFCAVIFENYKPGDVIWIQGTHLMILPSLLRECIPQATIGFYFHIPFPSVDVYRMVAIRKHLLEGLLGSDLIGFQIFSFARYFINACSRILGLSGHQSGALKVDYNNMAVRIEILSVGIYPLQILNTIAMNGILDKSLNDRRLQGGKKIILGKDRLDDIEGIPQKLAAIETLFEMFPEFLGNVIYIQVVEPDPDMLKSEYNEKISSINRTVGRINGKYGKLGYNPIEYIQGKILSPIETYTLFSMSDVALITPIREGMTINAHEFVVCHETGKPGVLILSNFAGSARCFGGALVTNPYSAREMALSIQQALTLDQDEVTQRHNHNLNYTLTNTSTIWTEAFVSDILKIEKEKAVPVNADVEPSERLNLEFLRRECKNYAQRIVIINCEGTIGNETEFFNIPQLMDVLTKLASDPLNIGVYLLTSKSKEALEPFAQIPGLRLFAEHGCFYKENDTWINVFPEFLHQSNIENWRRTVDEAMEYYTERTPGTRVTFKETSLVWHYMEDDYVTYQGKELLVLLQSVAAKYPIDIIQGNNFIEVIPSGVNKLNAVRKILLELNPAHDFVFYIGNGIQGNNKVSFKNGYSYAQIF